MRATRFPEVMRYIVTVITSAVAVFLLYNWLTFVLRRFPYTRPWGEALREFLLSASDGVRRGHARRGSRPLHRRADRADHAAGRAPRRAALRGGRAGTRDRCRGSIRRPPSRRGGWSAACCGCSRSRSPTRTCLAAGTDAFKGVSVFVGLMISLGSSGIVNQVMSGLTLTYSRALRLGDFVRIGDVEGTVDPPRQPFDQDQDAAARGDHHPECGRGRGADDQLLAVRGQRRRVRGDVGDHRLRHPVAAGAGAAPARGGPDPGCPRDAAAGRAADGAAGLLRRVHAARLPRAAGVAAR